MSAGGTWLTQLRSKALCFCCFSKKSVIDRHRRDKNAYMQGSDSARCNHQYLPRTRDPSQSSELDEWQRQTLANVFKWSPSVNTVFLCFWQARRSYQPIARWKHLHRWQMVGPELQSIDTWPHAFHYTTCRLFKGVQSLWHDVRFSILRNERENVDWVLFLSWLDRSRDPESKHFVFGIKIFFEHSYNVHKSYSP